MQHGWNSKVIISYPILFFLNIKDKVERQSQFRQTPELQTDKDRVLVQFN